MIKLKPSVFLLSVTLYCLNSFSLEKMFFNVEGKNLEFTWFKDQSITISSNCVKSSTIKNCKAKQALEVIKSSLLAEDHFGRNPGALLCSKQAGGTVVWAKDNLGNERTFCKFSDNSFVGSGSLFFYGHKNSK